MAFAWAKPYNNPMAIIQNPPDNWQGLVGSVNGKLKFSSMAYGVRAGVINLYNGYFAKGNNTLLGIFKVYAPEGHGGNNPKIYAEHIGKQIGKGISTKLDFNKYGRAISREIIKFETGDDITNAEFNDGFAMAAKRIGVSTEIVADGGWLPSSGITKFKWTFPRIVFVVGVAFIGYKIIKKKK